MITASPLGEEEAVPSERGAGDRSSAGPGSDERPGEWVATAAQATAGYDAHQRGGRAAASHRASVVYGTQRQTRCEAWCEERDGAASGRE